MMGRKRDEAEETLRAAQGALEAEIVARQAAEERAQTAEQVVADFARSPGPRTLEAEARVRELTDQAVSLTARLAQADQEADAVSRARQEADRRMIEARAERDLAEAEARNLERRLNVATQRAADYLARIRDLEQALADAPLEGAALVLRRQVEQTQDALAECRARSRARGSALAHLQEAHRRLKRGSASKDRKIGELTREVENAGLRGLEPVDSLASPEPHRYPARFSIPSVIHVSVLGGDSTPYHLVGFEMDREQGLTRVDLEPFYKQ